MTEKGRKEAQAGAERLKSKGYKFDLAYTSALSRAQTTLSIFLDTLGQSGIDITKDQALNERDYGELTGLNKDDARKKWGEDQVHVWRRSFDVPPPGGESLKMTAERTLPFYNAQIKPKVLEGKKVLVAAHGNSLRCVILKLFRFRCPILTSFHFWGVQFHHHGIRGAHWRGDRQERA